MLSLPAQSSKSGPSHRSQQQNRGYLYRLVRTKKSEMPVVTSTTRLLHSPPSPSLTHPRTRPRTCPPPSQLNLPSPHPTPITRRPNHPQIPQPHNPLLPYHTPPCPHTHTPGLTSPYIRHPYPTPQPHGYRTRPPPNATSQSSK
jgi:hypothetical protein